VLQAGSGARRAAPRKKRKLSEIRRPEIKNTDTSLTVQFALPNNMYFQAGTVMSYGADTEEFSANIGTEWTLHR
jgi:hypothetical protein